MKSSMFTVVYTAVAISNRGVGSVPIGLARALPLFTQGDPEASKSDVKK